MPRLVPSEAVAALTFPAIRDFLACPYRFLRGSIESDPDRRLSRPELLEGLAERLVAEMHRAKVQTGRDLIRDDVDAIAADIGGDLRIGAELLEAGTSAVWRWWRSLPEAGVAVVAVRAPYDLPVDEEDGSTWTLSGAAPIVVRTGEGSARPAILRLVEGPIDIQRIGEDPEIAILGFAAVERLRLESVVELHLAPLEPEEAPVRLEVPEAVDRLKRALSVVCGARAAILAGLMSSIFAFYPNRSSRECGRDLCRHVGACEETFGPGVPEGP